MNNFRRAVLKRAGVVIDTIHGEIELLATDEGIGEKESADKGEERRKGWQGKLADVQSEVEDIVGEEEEAAENTRSEERKEQMEEAVSQMTEFLSDVEELVAAEEVEVFTELWHSKYDSMVDNLETAAQ